MNSEMRKVSFDGGKTFIDIMDDVTFPTVVQKLRKAKNWATIVEAMETEAMMTAVEESGFKGQLVNAEQRTMFLALYLQGAKSDLIVKVS